MKLMTKKIEQSIPVLYAQDGKGDNAIAYVKYFTPDSNWTWFATEYDPNTKTFFGLVIGVFPELGYFTLDQLKRIRGSLNLPVERDLHFTPKTIKEIREEYHV